MPQDDPAAVQRLLLLSSSRWRWGWSTLLWLIAAVLLLFVWHDHRLAGPIDGVASLLSGGCLGLAAFLIWLPVTLVPRTVGSFAAAQQKRWRAVTALAALVIGGAHAMGFWALQTLDATYLFPPRPTFDQTLHRAWLTHLPPSQALSDALRQAIFAPQRRTVLAQQLHQTEASGLSNETTLFRLAQLHLSLAYRRPSLAPAEFLHATNPRPPDLPLDAESTHRAEEYLLELQKQARIKGSPYRSGTEALLGFLALSEGNHTAAQQHLEAAVMAFAPKDRSGLSLPLLQLLLVRATLSSGTVEKAEEQIAAWLAKQPQNHPLRPLALEHAAAVWRHLGEEETCRTALQKAEQAYTMSGDEFGVLRVQLQRTALAWQSDSERVYRRFLADLRSQAEAKSAWFVLSMLRNLEEHGARYRQSRHLRFL